MTIETTADWVMLATTIGFAGLLGALIATICVEGRHDRQAVDAKALHAHLARLERRLIDLDVQALGTGEPTMVMPRLPVEDRRALPPPPLNRAERLARTTELTVVAGGPVRLARVPVPMRHRPTFRATLAEIGVAL